MSFKSLHLPISAPALLLLFSTPKQKSASVPSWQLYPRLAIPNADQQILCRSEYETAVYAKRKLEHTTLASTLKQENAFYKNSLVSNNS